MCLDMTSDVLSDNDDLLHQLSAELGLPSFMDTDINQVLLLSLLLIIIIIILIISFFSNTGLPTNYEAEGNLLNTFFYFYGSLKSTAICIFYTLDLS